MKEKPLEPALKSRAKLTRWLYDIHNMVNGKLRGQGLLKEENPSFQSVKKVYEERVEVGCSSVEFEGWEFLFSIAENHPFSTKNSTPINDAPADVSSPEERNRWNLMTPQERMPFYRRFWASVGDALPFESWRKAWKTCKMPESSLGTRHTTVKALWKVRCCLEKELDLLNREGFEHLCKRLAEHRSGCGKAKKARTCRRITRKRLKD
jgi:hypothetical protein